MATSKCSYPKCPGYPLALRALCLGCKIHPYHHICQTDLEQEMGILLELTRKCHYCIWSVIEDHDIAKERREEAATAAVRIHVTSPPVDVAPSTIATNVAPVRDDFIPPSSIGVSQEATDAHTVTETLTNIAGNTNDGNIPPPVIAAAAVCNTEENTPPPTGKKSQHGFSKNSGLFCEKVSYFGQARERSDEDREEEKYGFGRIIEVPNKKKNLAHYVIEYDRSIHEDDTVVVQYTTHLPNTKEIKLLLNTAFARADEIDYRFGGRQRRGRRTQQHRIDPR